MNLQLAQCSIEEHNIKLLCGELYVNHKSFIIPVDETLFSDWGKPSIIVSRTINDLPTRLRLSYFSVIEHTLYTYDGMLGKLDDTTLDQYDLIIVNCAPYGNITLWLYGDKKSVLLCFARGQASDSDLNFNNLMQNEVRRHQKNNAEKNTHSTLIRNPINLLMQQYIYKYLIIFKENNSQPIFDYIEESLFDGTFDKLHDDGLLKYHEAGKPKKLAIKWHIKKSEYTAYFWFEDERICTIFERFYGAHPDTKTDFIIRIDAEQKKYELALFRQGLKEPQIIPENAYQLIVFKNKFEYYRSDNYNQERGAWIW